jgi:hypothetical protein
MPMGEVQSEHGEDVRVGDWEIRIVLMAFLNYLDEHPATRVLANEFTDVLTHLGALAAVPIQDESALA